MPAYDGLPQTLCIDEFRSTSNQMSFITIDGQKHDIITILPGRQTNEIKQFFLKVDCQIKCNTKNLFLEVV
ncbi:Mobile element protein [Levilactobacillus brevis]|nr:Mobile element protein [Levilactobacillus brevis]